MSLAPGSHTHYVTTAVVVGLEAHPVRLHLEIGAAIGHRPTPPEIIARAALTNTDFTVPVDFTTRLLSTDGTPLEPTLLQRTDRELPTALALLAAHGHLPAHALSEIIVAGELDMSGRLRRTRGIVPIAQMASQRRYRALLVPFEQLAEARLVPGITILPVTTLWDAVDRLATLTTDPPAFPATAGSAYAQHPEDPRLPPPLHRLLTIAAAGWHPTLLIGAVGTHADYAARQLVHYLPPPKSLDALEIATIHSAAALPLRLTRPVRMPHHSISDTGLFGQQSRVRHQTRPDTPGEVTLAHHGVLALVDLPEFPIAVLRRLRQVLRAGVIHGPKGLRFPAVPLLIATARPCPCGTAPSERCQCSPAAIAQYRARMQALADVFDIVTTLTGNGQADALLPIPFARIQAAFVRRAALENAAATREERLAHTIAVLDDADMIGAQHLHEAHALIGRV